MLYLLKEEKGSAVFYLIKDKEYVIGRKNADIVINNDQSISRKHAIIKIKANSATLLECGSKYGTLHNNSKIAPGDKILLEDGDLIKFGVYESEYKMEKLNIVTTGSGLTNDQKADLKNKMKALGGSVLSNWDSSCTYLTAQEIMLTIKVLHALIDDKPIVTLQYWTELLANMSAQKAPPKIEDFRPPIAETTTNKVNLAPNEARKTLFKDKTFVFTKEKVKNRMSDLIAKTGGASISWEKNPLTLLDVTKSSNYLFVHNDEPKGVPQPLKEIYQHLMKLGERTIPIQEIAMAIVLCSSEKDCNPKFNRLQSVFKEPAPVSQSEVFHLVGETPSDDGWMEPSVPKREIIIPGSLDADLQMLAPQEPAVPKSTPKRVENEPDVHPSKRMRMEEDERSLPSTSKHQIPEADSKKRKAEENLGSAAKKTSLKENPFAIKRRVSAKKVEPDSDNPFVALRLKQEISYDEDNPFLKILTNNEEEETVEAEEEPLETKPDFSQNYVPLDTSTVTWMSTTKAEEIEEVVQDPEMKEIFDKFKFTVVVEVLPAGSLRTRTPALTQPSPDVSVGTKNFKTFRKVQPLRPQKTFVSTSFKEEASANQIQMLSDGEEVGEEDEEVLRPVVKKTSVRRFNF